ncbi:MAG: hypothetical protein AAFR04_00665 [Pseudomonadota bacterium]
MPLQNRVTPEGVLIETPARGTVFGNRGGCFHDDERRLTHRRWVTKQWICCVLSFKGRRRTVMTPNRYTELFFLDEATAFSAGHRPCFECRRADATRFAQAWARAFAQDGHGERARAPAMDAVLHAERLGPDRRQRTHERALGALPQGAFIHHDDGSWLIANDALWPWAPAGYGAPSSARSLGLTAATPVRVLTPSCTLAVMAEGYVPSFTLP